MKKLALCLALISFTPKSDSLMMTGRLTAEEWNVVMKGLGELPAKESLPVILSLQQQFADQLTKPQKKDSSTTKQHP